MDGISLQTLARRGMFGRVVGALMFRTEDEFVTWLKRQAATPSLGLKLGIGDDAALVSVAKGRELILTSDLSIEDVHFRRDLHPPRSVGHRALARSLSDIAAMGGTPRFALVSLAISRGVSSDWIKAFYAGMSRLATRFDVAVVGGDTAVVPDRTTVDVIVAGEVPKGEALLRSGARPGDQVFVSGRLGSAALGLHLLESGNTSRAAWARTAIQAQLWPEPQCALGRFLAKRRLARTLIDISDGLSTDLARLCQASGVGARICEDQIPVPAIGATVAAVSPIAGVRWTPSESKNRTPPPGAAAWRIPRRVGLRLESEVGEPSGLPFRTARRGRAEPSPTVATPDPLQLALHGGEDYELLFTVPARKASAIPAQFRGVPLHRIGEIQKGKRIYLVHATGREKVLPPAGFDHFQKVR